MDRGWKKSRIRILAQVLKERQGVCSYLGTGLSPYGSVRQEESSPLTFDKPPILNVERVRPFGRSVSSNLSTGGFVALCHLAIRFVNRREKGPFVSDAAHLDHGRSLHVPDDSLVALGSAGQVVASVE